MAARNLFRPFIRPGRARKTHFIEAAMRAKTRQSATQDAHTQNLLDYFSTFW